jgi:hypothetical protein
MAETDLLVELSLALQVVGLLLQRLRMLQAALLQAAPLRLPVAADSSRDQGAGLCRAVRITSNTCPWGIGGLCVQSEASARG